MLRTGFSIYSLCSRRSFSRHGIYCQATKAASKSLEAPSVQLLTKISVNPLQDESRTVPPLIDPAVVKVHLVKDAQVTTISAPETITPSKLTKYYSSLAKFRLTGLVVCSAVTGYAMAPMPTEMTTLGLCLLGTALTSASANTINQFFEVPFDSQMARTNNRVLVRGLLR